MERVTLLILCCVEVKLLSCVRNNLTNMHVSQHIPYTIQEIPARIKKENI